jgi:hypothetical protein
MRMRYLLVIIIMSTACSMVHSQVPILNSYRVSTPSRPVPTVYLDFDGYLIDSSSVWFPYTGDVRYCEHANLSAKQIEEAFEIVAEDFRPFQVNITTDSLAYETAPPNKRQRVVITTTSDWFPGFGGVAYIGSFLWGDDSPVMVWSNNLNYNSKYVAEAASHEVGHGLGLYHHGYYEEGTCERSREYHGGLFGESQETSWGPIMGSVYYSSVTTWYFGDPCEGTLRDEMHDLKVIKQVLIQRADDFPQAQPQLLENDIDTAYHVSMAGSIETRTDSDHFKIVVPADLILLVNASPEKYYNSISNIDLRLRIVNEEGTSIEYRQPGMLAVTIDTLLKAGTYDIYVAGDGDEFYSNYGSLGRYVLSADSRRPVVNADLGPDLNICGDGGVRLDAGNEKLGSSVTYLWNTGETSRVINAQFGEYWVTVTDRRTGVQDSDTIMINGTLEMVVDFYWEGPHSTCKEATVNFKNVSYNACGTDPVAWEWDFGDGTTSTETGDVTHVYAEPGVYYVTLTASMSETQIHRYSDQEYLYVPEPEKPFVELGPDKSICRNNPVTLNANTNSWNEPRYLWSTGSTERSIDVRQTGKYWVRINTDEGCVNSDTILVHPSEGVLSNFSMELTGLRTVAFTDKSLPCNPAGEIDSWYWDFGDKTRSTKRNPTHFYKKPGTYVVRLTTTSVHNEHTVRKDITINYLGEMSYDGAVLRNPSRANKFNSNSVIDVPANIYSNSFTVLSTVHASYRLLNVSGQLLATGTLYPGTNQVMARVIPKGVFLMVVQTAAFTGTLRLVRQ